jgi:hypothetical protein
MLKVRPGERKMVFATPGRGVWGCKSMLRENSPHGLRKLPKCIDGSLPLTLKGSIASHPNGNCREMVCWIRVAGKSKWFLLRRQVCPDPHNILSLLASLGEELDIVPLGIDVPGFKNSELCVHADFIPIAMKILDAIKMEKEFEVPKLGGFAKFFPEQDPIDFLLQRFGMSPSRRSFYNTFAVCVGPITEGGANYHPKALLIADAQTIANAKESGNCKVRLGLLPDVLPTLLNVLRAMASRELVAFLV